MGAMTREVCRLRVPVGIETMRWPLRASLIRCAECHLEFYAGGITELSELADVVDAHAARCQGRAPGPVDGYRVSCVGIDSGGAGLTGNEAERGS
jgi:hypothetical protein